MRVVAAASCAAGVALLAWGEAAAWRMSRAGYPRYPQTGAESGDDVVLVLGYRPRDDGRLHPLQRWRVRIAVRSAPPGALYVFSGGIVHGTRPEAEMMAEYGVRRCGIDPARLALETQAMTTRENLAFATPWLEASRTIRIVSNTSHARRARRYLAEQAPALVPRLRRTRDFVPLELGPLRLALTFYDWVAGRVADRRDAEKGVAAPPPAG